MMQPQYQAGVRLSFGFSRSRRGTLIQDSMRLMMLLITFRIPENIPNPLPLIIAGFTIFAPMNSLSGVMRLESASCLHRALPKGKLSRKESISEKTATPKGKYLRMDCHPERKASPNGLQSRKESISEMTASPKGNASQKGPQSRKETHPRGSKEL